jgi:hypothetical protein
MSPAIYQSFIIEEGDSPETIRRKLYLGEISAGEQAYTLGAAIGECRKTITQIEARVHDLDELVNVLRAGFQELKKVEANHE